MSNNVGKALQAVLSEEGTHAQNPHVRRTLSQIGKCKTEALGYHVLSCKSEGSGEGCGHSRMLYHPCGNRHCPNCGGARVEEWVENRKRELLPTSYFHCVFTIPEELNSLVLGNRRTMYQLLMDASAETLLTLGKDPQWIGGTIGMTSILHTWGQTLSFHPHVHCIVSGGGIDCAHNWIKHKRQKATFIFPSGAVRKMFKGKMMHGIRRLYKQDKLKTEGHDMPELLRTIGEKKWNTYAKAPFKDPQGVVDYLGRYTHKIAITKHRIKEVNDKEIRFAYRDYNDGNKTKEMTLSRKEFTRRFALHILPKRFVKIRHYGYLSNHLRTERLTQIREKMKVPSPGPKVKVPSSIRLAEKYGKDLFQCPHCESGRMQILHTYRPTAEHPSMKGRIEAAEAVKAKQAPS